MSFISKVFHLNRTSCPRFPSHPNRTPLKISLSRLFAQEKKTTDAQKQTLKPSAAVGKHQLILEKGDDFLAAGLIPLKVEIIVLASKLRKKVVQRESIWIGTNCLYQNLASFKPLLLFTGGTFLVKLQSSSPPPPHQKKKREQPAKLLLSISCKTKVFRVLSTWTPKTRRFNAPHDWWAYVVSKGVSPWKGNSISVGGLNDWVTWVNTPPSGIYSRPSGLHQGGMEDRFPMGPPAPVPHLGLQTSIQKKNFNLSKCLLGVLPAAIINSVQWTENGHLSPFASWCNTLCRRLLWRWLLIYIWPGNTGSTSDSSGETPKRLKILVQLLYLHEDCELPWACCERHKSHWDHVELNCLWSATSDTDTLSSSKYFALSNQMLSHSFHGTSLPLFLVLHFTPCIR